MSFYIIHYWYSSPVPRTEVLTQSNNSLNVKLYKKTAQTKLHGALQNHTEHYLFHATSLDVLPTQQQLPCLLGVCLTTERVCVSARLNGHITTYYRDQ